MLETIKSQYESGNALVQGENNHLCKRELLPKFFQDFYPMGQDYYFELNPYFTFNIYRDDLFSFGKTFFVRDGLATFANFILKNHNSIPSFNTHFIIHPSLAPLIPKNCQQYFSCWQMVQLKKVSLEKAKRILIFGTLTEQYLHSLESLTEKIKPLQSLNSGIEIDIYLPLRREPFEIDPKESILYSQVIERIKETLGTRKLNFIMTKDLLERAMFTNCYSIDLAHDNFIISDNYIHYLVASRGGTVESFLSTPPADSKFKIPLSLNHEVHITAFPENTKSIFVDLLFAMKKSSVQPLFNTTIHELIRNL